MRKMQYKKVSELLDTLQEATNILLAMKDSDAKAHLTSDMLFFVNQLMEYIAGIPDTEQLLTALDRLKGGGGGILSAEFQQAGEWLRVIDGIREKLEMIKIEYTDLKELQMEYDFSRYLDLLRQISEDGYSILITTMDTPCGSPQFTMELGKKLQLLGLSVNLYNQWGASYCAVIDGGAVLDEKVSYTHSVSVDCRLGNSEITLKSAGMLKTDASSQCSAVIDGRQEAVCGRGISFIIYDKEAGKVIDSVNFDTSSEELFVLRQRSFVQNSDMSQVFKEFVDGVPGVVFMRARYPVFPKENLSQYEKRIINEGIAWDQLCQNPMISTPINIHIKEPSGILEVLTPPASYIGTDGARCFENRKGKYFNSVNGHRKTTGQPEKFKRTIYILGDCLTLGIGVRDEGTLASQLQALLNHYAAEEGFIVENYGFPLNGLNRQMEILSILKSLPLRAGDIVVGAGIYRNITGDAIDKTSYNVKLDIRPYEYGELFFDNTHLTEEAFRLVAEGTLETLKENDFFRNSLTKQLLRPVEPVDYHLSKTELSDLDHYKQMLAKVYTGIQSPQVVIGCIVMNCNPFTLGHRYLIEQCAKKCDILMVFVVQEDKSFFPFEDRIHLVREGNRDLENVYVLESGKFILSSRTFEGYFNKSKLQDRIVDSSEDVTLFAREIAPAAHIQVRFAGTEPLDTVTRQYNRTLAVILPQYGIRFEEIPRLEKCGEVISASKVRRLLEERKWDDIQQIVPDITYSYLINKFGD